MKIIKNYLAKNRCYQQNKKRTPIGIQLHTIGTGQGTAQSVADYWNQSAVSACVTYIVDCDTPGKVLQCLPEDVYSWADGGYGNKNLITFEICESDYIKYTSGANYTVSNANKFKADIMRGYNTAVELCADICKRYGWNPQAKLPSGLYLISSHDEGRRAGLSTAHVDPTHVWDRFGLNMDKFRADVVAAMNGKVVVQPETAPLYRVRKVWTDVQSQIGAYTVLENAKKACLPGYSVYDENGKQVYTVQAKGFQASDLRGLSEADRIEKIAPLYQENMKKTGMLASPGIAMFCLESGYGTTDLAEFANNLHGMKCSLSGNTWSDSAWDGVSKYTKQTKEQTASGQEYTVTADFRKYPCCEDSIADRAAYFIGAMNGAKKRYPNINKQTDYKKAIQIIKDGGYATDVNYISKLVNLVERWNLFQYDQGIEIPSDTGGDILPKTDEPWYRVRKSWGKTMDGQLGAYHDLEKAKEKVDENPEYKVFDEDGKVVYEINNKEETAVNKVIKQCKKFQKQLMADITAGRSWTYHNPSKYLEEQWSKALSKGKRSCNCALLARWALKEAGLIPQDTGIFYGKSDGSISWSSATEKAVRKSCDVIRIGNKTVNQLISDGTLQPGDVVTYMDLQHTNIYAGGSKWYDAGHAYCNGSGEGAVYKSWHGKGQYGSRKVAYIIREKGAAKEEPAKSAYIVQVGSYSIKANAESKVKELKKKGFDAFVKTEDSQYKVQAGSFSKKENAENLASKLKKAGFVAIIK